MKEKICPACGGTVKSEEAKFCPLCGAALPELPEMQTVPALEERLKERYAAYNDWVTSIRAKESGGRKLLNLISNSGPFKNSEEHMKFFDEAKALSEELLAHYQATPGAGDLCGLLRFTLVGCHSEAHKDADWMFLAAEQLYLPLLTLLSREEAAVLLPEYQALRKKQKGFAFQTKILNTLKTMGK